MAEIKKPNGPLTIRSFSNLILQQRISSVKRINTDITTENWNGCGLFYNWRKKITTGSKITI